MEGVRNLAPGSSSSTSMPASLSFPPSIAVAAAAAIARGQKVLWRQWQNRIDDHGDSLQNFGSRWPTRGRPGFHRRGRWRNQKWHGGCCCMCAPTIPLSLRLSVSFIFPPNLSTSPLELSSRQIFLVFQSVPSITQISRQNWPPARSRRSRTDDGQRGISSSSVLIEWERLVE
jgi:hypothetical protein